MAYTQEPFPDSLSERTVAKYGPGAPFRHRETVRGWIEDIFLRHRHLLELNTTVERALKNNQGEWVITLRKETPAKDYWWEETFDALVVATGHYNVPWIPNIPGIVEFDSRFPGKILHSKHFRGPQEFEGKVCFKHKVSPLGLPRILTVSEARRYRGWVRLFARNHPRDTT